MRLAAQRLARRRDAAAAGSRDSAHDLTRRLHGQKRGQSFVGRLVNRVVGALRPFLGPGYVDEHGRPLQAHLFASALLFVFLLVYAVGYFAWMPGTARGAGVPALVYLLTIAILANWFLSGVAFYLDRYHLPTLLPLVAWTLLIWGISRSDHYFELRDRPRDAPALALPAQVAVARPEPLLTVIASDGGGAQAAGWAATVLTGIQERWPGFQGSTRLISAVSGGSVGTMYFVASLREDRSSTAVEPPRGARSDRARQPERSGMGTGLPRSVARADVDSSLVPLREGPRMGDGAGVDARLAPSVAVGDAGRCQRGLAPVDCAERDRRGNGRALRVRDVRRTRRIRSHHGIPARSRASMPTATSHSQLRRVCRRRFRTSRRSRAPRQRRRQSGRSTSATAGMPTTPAWRWR